MMSLSLRVTTLLLNIKIMIQNMNGNLTSGTSPLSSICNCIRVMHWSITSNLFNDPIKWTRLQSQCNQSTLNFITIHKTITRYTEWGAQILNTRKREINTWYWQLSVELNELNQYQEGKKWRIPTTLNFYINDKNISFHMWVSDRLGNSICMYCDTRLNSGVVCANTSI